MRLAAAVVVLAGCDSLFNLEHLDPIDASMIDAPPIRNDAFNPDSCGSDYQYAWWLNSRFRIITLALPAWSASDACMENQPPGTSHLAVAPTREKLDVFLAKLSQLGENQWWLGAVQPLSATTPTDKWLWVTGEPIDLTLWDVPNEPNDSDGVEMGHEDQFGVIDRNRPGMIDYGGTAPFRALCECDGRPITEEARVAIEQSRP